ncbi:BA75_04548T0 [Komagataella pastoris]|uniref:BA75_04548T0 n=1 Tax=Komagataella pastoris TaxID=4922 RepID=A0A1B2JJ25_PICPA|nr:BA75_04548T0 [Komagataella pastoris]
MYKMEENVDEKRLLMQLKISEIKLKRVTELNNTLKQSIARERITSSNSCLMIINTIRATSDPLLPAGEENNGIRTNSMINPYKEAMIMRRNDNKTDCCIIA